MVILLKCKFCYGTVFFFLIINYRNTKRMTLSVTGDFPNKNRILTMKGRFIIKAAVRFTKMQN